MFLPAAILIALSSQATIWRNPIRPGSNGRVSVENMNNPAGFLKKIMQLIMQSAYQAQTNCTVMEKGLFWDVPFFIHAPTEGWLKSVPSNVCWCPLKTEVERVHLSGPLSASLKKKSTPPYFPIRKPSLGAIADKKWNVLFLRNIRLNITVVPG